MMTATDPQGFPGPASPPTKASLTWWEKFKGKGNPKKEEEPKEAPGIFGVPLQQSIEYARVAISMHDQNGNSFIYGYIPIVIAKCGVFLKEKATDVEGIFRLSGSAKRIKDLQVIFNSPDKYGKNLDWAGYTVHDAANILRRYLNQLPEPIIPLDYYDRFRQPLQGTFDEAEAIKTYQRLISELPALNRQLLLYILDLLAVFASKADINLMPAANLAAIFQPGLISHPDHEMSPADYRLSQDVLIFLIQNQDNFLLGMRGSDDAVPNEGYQKSVSPNRKSSLSKRGLDRHPLDESAAAVESVKKFGLKRNSSTSSKRSISSPILGSLSRSNTVPSRKNRSPSTPTFQPRTPQSPRVPLSPVAHSKSYITEGISSKVVPMQIPEDSLNPNKNERCDSTQNLEIPPAQTEKSTSEFSETLEPAVPAPTADQPTSPSTSHPLVTPTKEKSFASYFQRSPGNEAEKKTSNRLRKKKMPGSQTPSAESSTASLNGSASHPVPPSIPPIASPTFQQSPLGPISASPPSNDVSLADPNKPLLQRNSCPPYTAESQQKPSNYMNVPHSKGIQSASTSSLLQQISQTPSRISSVSSNSEQAEKKHKSNWRKSAKWNLSTATHFASEKLSGLTSPPLPKSQNNNSSNPLNNRRRSQSVGEKTGDNQKKGVSKLPQRGSSASGQHSPNVESVGAIGWLQKKLNERMDKIDKEKEKNMLNTAQIPPPVVAEVDSHPSDKKRTTA